MFILLPTEKEGIKSLNKLEAQLTVDLLEQLFSRMEPKTVSLQLPKFRIQQKLQLKVIQLLLISHIIQEDVVNDFKLF